jgi:hypothetical protein
MLSAKRKRVEREAATVSSEPEGGEVESDAVSLRFSDDDSSESESEGSGSGSGSSESDTSQTDNEELHIFPIGKTVVSRITGQALRQYPEIEPGYDSDSSTEEVRTVASWPSLLNNPNLGPEQNRRRPTSLVRRLATYRLQHRR